MLHPGIWMTLSRINSPIPLGIVDVPGCRVNETQWVSNVSNMSDIRYATLSPGLAFKRYINDDDLPVHI